MRAAARLAVASAARRRASKCALALCVAAALGCAAGSGQRAGPDAPPGIPVLVYHQIVPGATQPDDTLIALERFEEQMAWLAANGWSALTTAELVAYMRGEYEPPPRSVVIQFDDGWRNVLNAVPVLERLGLRASFWIISHAGIGWDNLEWEHVEQLDAHPLFEVGSHTATHPWDPEDNLVTWSDGRVPGKGLPEIRHELEGSRALLEARLGRPVRYLAWPRGWYDERLIALAHEAGYQALLTVDDGLNRPGDDVLRIRRVMIDGRCDLEVFVKQLSDPRFRECAPREAATTVRRAPHSPYELEE